MIKLFDQDPALLEPVGAHGGRRDQEDSRRRRRGRTESKTPSADPRAPSKWIRLPRRAPDSRPQELELDASAILQGEPAPTPVVVNDRSYNIRVRFPEAIREGPGFHPQDAADQRNGQDGDARLTGDDGGRSRTDGDPARQFAAQRAGDGALRALDLGTAWKRSRRPSPICNVPPSIRVQYGGLYAEQQKSFKDFGFVLGWLSCWCSWCCCSSSATSPRPSPCFPRRCFPLAAFSSRCW